MLNHHSNYQNRVPCQRTDFYDKQTQLVKLRASWNSSLNVLVALWGVRSQFSRVRISSGSIRLWCCRNPIRSSLSTQSSDTDPILSSALWNQLRWAQRGVPVVQREFAVRVPRWEESPYVELSPSYSFTESEASLTIYASIIQPTDKSSCFRREVTTCCYTDYDLPYAFIDLVNQNVIPCSFLWGGKT